MAVDANVYIAHQRKTDGASQKLEDHLLGVSELGKSFAAKIRLEEQGELIGLLHDLGKYSNEFQAYLQSAVGLINPDEDDTINKLAETASIARSRGRARIETFNEGTRAHPRSSRRSRPSQSVR